MRTRPYSVADSEEKLYGLDDKNQSKHKKLVTFDKKYQMEAFNPEDVVTKPELESYVHKPDLAQFLSEAKLIDPDLLAATIGPLLYPHISIWDVLIQKTK